MVIYKYIHFVCRRNENEIMFKHSDSYQLNVVRMCMCVCLLHFSIAHWFTPGHTDIGQLHET